MKSIAKLSVVVNEGDKSVEVSSQMEPEAAEDMAGLLEKVAIAKQGYEKEWRISNWAPGCTEPPGMKNPRTEAEARKVFEELLLSGFSQNSDIGETMITLAIKSRI